LLESRSLIGKLVIDIAVMTSRDRASGTTYMADVHGFTDPD